MILSEMFLKVLMETCEELDITYHKTGTMVAVEGPRYSSRAESHMFRQWGGHVINMSTCPEVCPLLLSFKSYSMVFSL